MECCNSWAAFEIGTDGSMIGMTGEGMVVLDPDGRLRANFPQPAYAWQVTWNRQSDRIARLVDRNDEEWLLQYWRLGTQQFTLIDSFPHTPSAPGGLFPPTTISWSNDGSAIAYSKAGKIFVYTLAHRNAVPVATGKDPEWSPDGNWIAYRDDIGHTFVMDPGTRSSHVLIPKIKILGEIRWSPDSQFVLVSVRRSMLQLLRLPLLGFENETEFIIYRVSDGAMLRINPLMPGTTAARVFWVVKP
jgi:hypothetical protein